MDRAGGLGSAWTVLEAGLCGDRTGGWASRGQSWGLGSAGTACRLLCSKSSTVSS